MLIGISGALDQGMCTAILAALRHSGGLRGPRYEVAAWGDLLFNDQLGRRPWRWLHAGRPRGAPRAPHADHAARRPGASSLILYPLTNAPPPDSAPGNFSAPGTQKGRPGPSRRG